MDKKVYDSLAGMTEIRTNGRENWDYKQTMNLFEKLKVLSVKVMILLQGRGTTRKSIIQFSMFGVMLYGIYLVKAESISVGDFIAFLFYYEMFVSNVTTLITNLTEQKVLMIQAEKCMIRFI